MTTLQAVSERSERRWHFVLVLIAVLLGMNLVTLGLIYHVKTTIDTNSRKRSTQIARVEQRQAKILLILQERK